MSTVGTAAAAGPKKSNRSSQNSLPKEAPKNILPQEQTFAPKEKDQQIQNENEQNLNVQEENKGQENQVLDQRDKPITIPIHDLNQLRLQKKAIKQQNQIIDQQILQKQQKGNINNANTEEELKIVEQKLQQMKQKQQINNLLSPNSNTNISSNLNDLPQINGQNAGQFNKKNLQMIQIRQKFLNLLGKLIDLQTRDIANQQLQDMILNNFSPEYLRVWISALGEYHTRPANFSSSETEILLIGHIASVYKEKLLDPIDRPPSVVKASYKLCEMIQRYFYAKQINESIQKACSESWCQIYQNCLKNQSLQNKEIVLYTTLRNIINGGGDRVAQTTSVFVLDQLLLKLAENYEEELIFSIAKSFLPQIFTRSGIDSPSIYKSCKHIIQTLHIKNLIIYTSIVIEKCMQQLNDRKTQYKIKIVVCELLELIAIQFQEMTENIVGSYHEQVIPVLQSTTRDRILQVQSSAKQALQQWIKFQNQFENLEQFKLHKQQKLTKNIDVDELIQQKTGAEVNPKQAKDFKTQSDNQFYRPHHKDDRPTSSNVFSKQPAWVQETRSKDFVKKKTGTGGGCLLINADNMKKPQASYENQRNFLKEQIFGNKSGNYYFNKNQNIPADQLLDVQIGQQQEFLSNQIYNSQDKIENSILQKNNKQRQQLNESEIANNPNIIPPMSHQKENSYEIDTERFLDNDELAETLDYNGQKERQAFKQKKSNLNNPIKQTQQVRYDIKEIQEENIKKNEIREQNIQLSDMWNETLEYADSGQYEKAFSSVLQSGDDIYLIRLMLRNKNGFKHLQRATQLQIIKKIIQFMQSNFLAKLCLGFFQDSVDCGLTKYLIDGEQQQILEILYEMSDIKSDIGPQASELFVLYQSLFRSQTLNQNQQIYNTKYPY
ncbi:hypothetical protein ABPG72_015471 [Tetrahymena utriculariae]